MTETERGLVALLERKASEIGSIAVVPPRGLRGRARRRQARTAIPAFVVVAVVAAAVTVGVTAALNGSTEPEPAAPGATSAEPIGFSTGGVQVTFPRDWTFLSLSGSGPELEGGTGPAVIWPIMQVSNFYPVAPNAIRCPGHPGEPGSFPPTGVMLYVQQVLWQGGAAQVFPRWPVPADSIRIGSASSNPCRASRPVRWQAGFLRLYEGSIVAGPDASQKDRAAALRAFRSLRFIPISTLAENTRLIPLGTQIQISSGSLDGVPWTFLAQKTDRGICFEVDYPGAQYKDCAVGDWSDRVGVLVDRIRRPGRPAANFIGGPLDPDVASVRVELSDGRTLIAEPLEVPSAIYEGTAPSVYYLVPVVGSRIEGRVIAIDARGEILDEQSFAPLSVDP